MRYITTWRKTGDKMLEWDHHVSEDERELENVIRNIKDQGVRQYNTFVLGDLVREHSTR